MSRFRFVILGRRAGSGRGRLCPGTRTGRFLLRACTATTQDANGRTMWCNPTMTGDHSLVWQYGGPGE